MASTPESTSRTPQPTGLEPAEPQRTSAGSADTQGTGIGSAKGQQARLGSADFVPVNEVERALLYAAKDPSARPDFYRAVLSSPLFFLTPDASAGPDASVHRSDRPTGQAAAEIETVTLLFWNSPRGSFLPIFSSRERFEQAVAATGEAYGFASLLGREVFQELAGASSSAVLNPGLPFSKYFVPEEIRAMLDGSIYQGETISIEREAEVELSDPVVHPQALVDALRHFFSAHDGIDAAYLALIHDPQGAEPPHPIIGVVGERFDELVEQAGAIAAEILRGPVDFVPLTGEEEVGLGAQLRRGRAPFFERRALR